MSDVTLDAVAESVSQLRSAVEAQNEGALNREAVEQIAREVVEANRERSGYQPPEGGGEDEERELPSRLRTPLARMRFAHERSAGQASRVLGVSKDQVEEFQRASDRLLIVANCLKVDPRETNYYSEEFEPLKRAMDTATSGEGAEFVPRELSANLIDRVTLQLQVVNLFGQPIDMPTNPFDLPARALSRTRGGRHTEQTADTGQTKVKVITPGSRKVTLTAAKFATEVLTSKEAEEDAIIAALPFIEEELRDFTAADLEDAAVNGDTTGTHQDSNVTAADDPRKNWKGLRKLALANSATRDHSNAIITVAGLRAQRKLMGKYGISPSDLAHVISIGSYINLLSDSNVLTVDKYGANATVLTGELAKADGVPVIVSEYVQENLNASGVYDGTTTNRSCAITANRRALVRGKRRDVTVQVLKELYAESDQDALIVSHRQALTEVYTGDKAIAMSYNVQP